MIDVTIFNEYKHEREIESIRKVYPDGIHGCLKSFLETEDDIRVHTATFEEPEHGLTEELLEQTDVLIFWIHALQDEFSDDVTARNQSTVLRGMGLITLHSGHYSKPMRLLLGTTMTLGWRDDDHEKLWCVAPSHPIAAGIPMEFEIPREEMYCEYFDIPKPDDVIFLGTFSRGEAFRSGVTFTRGNGRIFYFQPGHEEYPVYYMPEIQQIIRNAVRWAAPAVKLDHIPGNRHVV